MSGTRTFLEVAGVRLCLLDFGGTGSVILILHGLGGSSYEWAAVAAAMTRHNRVFGLDLRGQGGSTKGPTDMSTRAYVEDVCAVLRQINSAPVCLVGPSFGAHVALGVASQRLELVRALVVAEGSAEAAYSEEIRDWFQSWPIPFANRVEAERFFSASGLDAKPWADALTQAEDGLRPIFRIEDIVATLDAARDPLWESISGIRAPTLLLTADRGLVPKHEVERMLATIPRARHVLLTGVGHDLHLDDPGRFVAEVQGFLDAVGAHD